MPHQPSPQRYHSLDAMRAVAMLGGLVFHTAINYTSIDNDTFWPYQDRHNSPLFDFIALFLHLFRMPMFFVVAGFFAALLLERKGRAEMISNRAKRVLIPLLIAWPLLYPASEAVSEFARFRSDHRDGGWWWDYLVSGRFLKSPHLFHLWFLYDLMIFYVCGVFISAVTERLPAGLRAWGLNLYDRSVKEFWGVPVWAAATFVTLLPMKIAGLDGSDSFLPPLRLLAAYGVFVGFGWILYHRRGLLDNIASRFGWNTFCATIFTLGYVATHMLPALRHHVLGVAMAAPAIWYTTFAVTGFFVRWCSNPSPTFRYVSDASYWVYLVHLPFTIWLPALMSEVEIVSPLKFLIALSGTVAISFASYHYCVRYTAIGGFLNGRKFTREGERWKKMPAKLPE